MGIVNIHLLRDIKYNISLLYSVDINDKNKNDITGKNHITKK